MAITFFDRDHKYQFELDLDKFFINSKAIDSASSDDELISLCLKVSRISRNACDNSDLNLGGKDLIKSS